jgi:predicted Zn-dependent protease
LAEQGEGGLMTVSRDPDSPIRDTRRALHSRDEGRNANTLISQAVMAADDGDVVSATEALVKAATSVAVAALPGRGERKLIELAMSETVAPVVRAQAWRVYARSREARGAAKDAKDALERAYTLAPGPDLLLELARSTYRIEGTEAAEGLARDGLARWPDEPGVQVFAISQATASGDTSRARALLDDALRCDPAPPELLGVLARLELTDGHPERAIEPARQLVPSRPSIGRALLVMALHRAGRLHEDPALLDAVLADRPDDARLLTGLARALIDADRPAEARDVLNRAHELDDDDLEVYRTRGLANA